MDMVEVFQRLGIALAIGFLVGVERGWKQRFDEDESRVAGLRTYTLIGLLGGVAGRIGAIADPLAFSAIALVFGLAWIIYKFFETWTDGDMSMTGLVAGLLVFALGAYAQIGGMAVAAAAGVVVVGVLAFKDAAHAWVKALTWEEIRSALIILAASLIALPLLPDRALDPYGAFNPRSLWAMTILLASVSFAGYVALRTFGAKLGLALAAAIGAVVSSTAVTLDLARRAKAGELAPTHAAAAATLASAIMFARVGALIAIFAAPALEEAAPAVIAACLVSLAFAVGLGFFRKGEEPSGTLSALGSPLDLIEVGRFALVLGVVTVAARLIAHFFGDAGLIAFAASAGLVDVDAVALAVGGLTRSGLDHTAAAEAILLAAAMNTLSKTAIAIGLGGPRFALTYGAAALCALAAGAAAFVLF